MGMKQKRCPSCKKKRRFDHDSNNKNFADSWMTINGLLICNFCIQNLLNKKSVETK
jgi:hypothetical protein